MPVILPAVGSFNWADSLNAAVQALSDARDAQKLTNICSGVASVNLVASDFGNKVVTYPAGRFSAPPIVVATMAAGSHSYLAGVGAQTVNGFTITAFHRDNTATTVTLNVNWIAVATL